MLWYQWLAILSLTFCLCACLAYGINLVRKGRNVDYSRPAGNSADAILYAFTRAMSPVRKESAYLHLPTYTAGMLYHMGNFLSFFLFFFIISGNRPDGWLAYPVALFLCISTISGLAILIKRIVRKELMSISNPDDFISNILVTSFEFFTLLMILTPLLPASYRFNFLASYGRVVTLTYYLVFTLLGLYIPLGKLRHTVYFFAARYHLGDFFGRRGVWPLHKTSE